jgi:hypothetical protein
MGHFEDAAAVLKAEKARVRIKRGDVRIKGGT